MPLNPGSAREGWERPTVRIDWWHGSMMAESPKDDLTAVSRFLRGDIIPMRGPPKGFGRARCDYWMQDQCMSNMGEKRTHVDRHGEILTLGRFLILKGTGIQELRHEGTYDRALLGHVSNWKGKTNRIDLAIDVRHPDVSPLVARGMYESDQFVTRVQRHRWNQGKGNGGTLDLISQHKTLRIYDKSGERAQRTGATPLEDGVTRFEMEYRGKPARAVFEKLRRIHEHDWDDEFPRLAVGWMLQFARPLDGPRPDHNPQRAPMWAPLEEALEGLGPVRLNSSVMRGHEERFGAKARHVANNAGIFRMMAEVIGEARLLQLIRSGTLTEEQLLLIGWAKETPDSIEKVLHQVGFGPGEEVPNGEDE